MPSGLLCIHQHMPFTGGQAVSWSDFSVKVKSVLHRCLDMPSALVSYSHFFLDSLLYSSSLGSRSQ